MLKTFSQIEAGKTFVDYSGGASFWRKRSHLDAECMSDDDGSFIKGEVAAFSPGEVCSLEPGISEDFEVKLQLTNPDMFPVADRVARDTHVDMALALSEDRIHVLDPHGTDEPYCFVVVAPHSMERFDTVLAVDVWLVDALGKKAEGSYPNPVPEWKANFSSLAHMPEHEALVKGLFDEPNGLLVTPEQSAVTSPSVKAAPPTPTTNSLEM